MHPPSGRRMIQATAVAEHTRGFYRLLKATLSATGFLKPHCPTSTADEDLTEFQRGSWTGLSLSNAAVDSSCLVIAKPGSTTLWMMLPLQSGDSYNSVFNSPENVLTVIIIRHTLPDLTE